MLPGELLGSLIPLDGCVGPVIGIIPLRHQANPCLAADGLIAFIGYINAFGTAAAANNRCICTPRSSVNCTDKTISALVSNC